MNTANEQNESGTAPVDPTPMGINLRAEPPRTRHMSRRLGAVIFCALFVLVAFIIYGIFARQTSAAALGKRAGAMDGRVTGAKEAGKAFSNPSGTVADLTVPDALEPPPLSFIPKRDVKGKAQVPGEQGKGQGPVTIARSGTAGPQNGAGSNTVPAALRTGQGQAGYQNYQTVAGGPGAGQPPGWDSPAAWGAGALGQTGGTGGGSGANEAASRRADREREAMDAPTGINGAGTGKLPSAEGDIAGLVSALGGAASGAGPGGGGAGPRAMAPTTNTISGAPRDPEDDGGGQAAKSAFLAKARSGGAQNYVQSTRVRALSPFEVKAGWDIPAVLEQEINSDLPGEIRALVRESVYDTASGNYLLIPQGSRLVGQYDSKVAYAQSALLVVWDRVIFPDGSSIDLEGMGSQDVKGQSGLRGKVNHHYGRLFGTAALSTAFSVAAVVAQNRRQNVFSLPSSQDVATSAAASEISRLGAAITRKNLNIQPTIRILTGTRFSVRVHKDLLFEAPYRPYPQGGERAVAKQ